jgi:hypothetical protein
MRGARKYRTHISGLIAPPLVAWGVRSSVGLYSEPAAVHSALRNVGVPQLARMCATQRRAP